MKSCLILILLGLNTLVYSQQIGPIPSNVIYVQLQKLNVLGNAMYLAAHPDDENTRLISYLTNQKHFNTTYLSLTRGDGGQNLIGTELGALLGVLRTHELLQARSVDGGKQWFTRANDFGFSKHPDETMSFWKEAEILKDMVGAIRRFRPDVIINRFSTKNIGETHGHHSASAILADKAILLAADPNYKIENFPFGPWQESNMYCNTSSFFYKTKEEFDKADKTNLYKLDCGVYFPLLGYSNGELAARSRSMHRCQGFGSAYSRGSVIEYLELLNGTAASDKNNPFSELNTNWDRVEGGSEVQVAYDQILKTFDFNMPQNSIQALISLYDKVGSLKDNYWKKIKQDEINQIILNCAGFYTEVVTDQQTVCPGDSIKVDVEYINRSAEAVSINSLTLIGNQLKLKESTLAYNNDIKETFKIGLPQNLPFTSPYWLKGKFSPMMYDVKDRMIIGQPENDPVMIGMMEVQISGHKISYPIELFYKSVNPAFGQKYDKIQVVPELTVNLKRNSVVAKSDHLTKIECIVRSSKGFKVGEVILDLPKGWKSIPASIPVSFKFKGEKKDVSFMIEGSHFDGIDSIGAHVISDGQTFNRGFEEIKYDHLPYRVINMPNKVAMSVVKSVKSSGKIGYISGAGDLVFESLRDAGHDIELIDPTDFDLLNFKKYKSIILGIRAFNVLDQSEQLNNTLNLYTEQGGHVIVQYNTSNNLKIKQFGPYPLTLGRTRVTDEHAVMTILQPDHNIFNKPNKITQDDFKYWVQERGVYFADKYDEHYIPMLSMNDKNENPSSGSLIIANYGKGTYIYTGLVFYRELPAGIPGAYRLIENMLSL